MPKMSFVLAVRDGEKYLKNTIESILAQKVTDLELIIVNDHSTDNTKKIAQSFSEKDGRVILLDSSKEGVAAARNLGNNKASGEIILPCDADDPNFPNRAEVTVAELEKHKADIFYSNLERFFEDTGERVLRHFQPYDAELLHYINFIAHAGSSAYHKYVWEKVGGYDETIKIGEDYDLWLKAQEAGFKFTSKNIALSQYTMHAGQTTQSTFKYVAKNPASSSAVVDPEKIRKRQAWNKIIREKHKIYSIDLDYVKTHATPEVIDFYINKNFDIWFGKDSIPKKS